jgi:uncharacterized protein YjbI with pentapeptide repeats
MQDPGSSRIHRWLAMMAARTVGEHQVHEQKQSRWQPTNSQLLWSGGIVAVLTVAVLIGYRYDITLWDWIKLLIVPAVIAGGGIWFSRQQRVRELEMAEQRTKEDRKIAQERSETDRKIADQQRQNDTLQAYLDQIGELFLSTENPLHESKNAQALARARTLAVLKQLDPERKESVLWFLVESNLIESPDPTINLARADFSGISPKQLLIFHQQIHLLEVNLQGADLSNVVMTRANLAGADLRGATLPDLMKEVPLSASAAKLEGADLSGRALYDADLTHAHLTEAKLRSAILERAHLNWADLRDADLVSARLVGADLSNAKLDGAELSWANLTGATVTDEQLATCKSLRYATMPNGKEYEDWLNSKGRGEDGQNPGSS